MIKKKKIAYLLKGLVRMVSDPWPVGSLCFEGERGCVRMGSAAADTLLMENAAAGTMGSSAGLGNSAVPLVASFVLLQNK